MQLIIFSFQLNCTKTQYLQNNQCVKECTTKKYFYSHLQKMNVCINVSNQSEYICNKANLCDLNCSSLKLQFKAFQKDNCVQKCEKDQFYKFNDFGVKECGLPKSSEQLICDNKTRFCAPNCSQKSEYVDFKAQKCTLQKKCFYTQKSKNGVVQSHQTVLYLSQFQQYFCSNDEMVVQDILEKNYSDPEKLVVYEFMNLTRQNVDKTVLMSYIYKVVEKCSAYIQFSQHPAAIGEKKMILECASECRSKTWQQAKRGKLCFPNKEQCTSKAIIKQTGECVAKCQKFYVLHNDGYRDCHQKCPTGYQVLEQGKFQCKKAGIQQNDLIVGGFVLIFMLLIVLLAIAIKTKKTKIQQKIRQLQIFEG